ncbi:transmembrane cytochrome oxidase [Ramlibacter tataouinensis]|uniref:SURF1-like protein n=1 Tax=Ramlibacter tataouinensis TaxID=94132 RepID=A0A127JS18_9BURK|nr:transmembrane cytochrome oxidase [Ramlibacter tataouinensis]
MRAFAFWAITVVAALAVAATAALGFWQLGRGRDKDALQAAIEAREALPAVPPEAMSGTELPPLMHRSVVLRGTWDERHTVFLDNRQMHGRVGFYVVTPLKLEGGGAVLVQRGWAPRDFMQREKLPAVQTPPGVVEVRGRIAPPPARLYQFGGAGAAAIRQNLDLDSFRAETGLPLPELAVVQNGAASEGLLRDWPRAGSGSEKNYGYAFQWWALSALIAILYVWFQFIAPRRRKVPPA